MSSARIVNMPPERQAPGQDLPDLGACLIHAARLQGRTIDVADLPAGPGGPGGAGDGSGIRAALALAERSGLIASFGKLALRDLDALLCPAILILSGNRAVVVEGRAGPDRLVVHDPALAGAADDEPGEIAIAALEQVYGGYALLLRARHRAALSGSGWATNGAADGAAHGAANGAANGAGAGTGHWFWSALGDSRWIYVQVVLAAVVANVLGLATSIFTMVVYDRVLPNEAVESLLALTLGVGMALVFDFLIKSLRAGFIDLAGQRADKAVGRRIFDQVLDRRRTISTGCRAGDV